MYPYKNYNNVYSPLISPLAHRLLVKCRQTFTAVARFCLIYSFFIRKVSFQKKDSLQYHNYVDNTLNVKKIISRSLTLSRGPLVISLKYAHWWKASSFIVFSYKDIRKYWLKLFFQQEIIFLFFFSLLCFGFNCVWTAPINFH